jgi:hypothetical protein
VSAFRQLVRALAARFLLRDSWPLRKVAEPIRASDIDALLAMAPGATSRTPAEAAVARIRGSSFESPRYFAMSRSVGELPRASTSRSSGSFTRPAASLSAADPALEMAVDITQLRSALTDNLRALGNESGTPERRRLLRLELAPWCHVDLDADELRKLDEHTPEILGTALTQALQEERLKEGE